jgi:hypothetical protein
MAEHGRVVEDDHDAGMGQRRDVPRAQHRVGAEARRAGRQDGLLPGVPGPVGEPRPGGQHGVAAGPQPRQAARELARPALDAAELGANRGARVDRHHAGGRRLRAGARVSREPGGTRLRDGLVRVGQRA